MSKKTRKEKIIASYRRKLHILKKQETQPAAGQPQETVHQPVKPVNIIEKKLAPADEDLTIKKFFLSDLRKSAVIISLIIALEIVFYFVRIKGY